MCSMERQRSFSERSISSAESWELVKVDNHEETKLFFVPSAPDETESSVACDESFFGCSSISNSFPTEFSGSADEKLSVNDVLLTTASLDSSDDPNQPKWKQTTVDCGEKAVFEQFENWFETLRQASSTTLSTDGGSVVADVDMDSAAGLPSSPRVLHAVQQVTKVINNGSILAANQQQAKLVDPVGVMTVLFFAMAITAFLSIIENFVWVGFHLPSNHSAGNGPPKMATIETENSVELVHEFYASCKAQLEEQKIAYTTSLDAVRRLQSEKAVHKKTITKLQAELAKLKIAIRSAANSAVDDEDDRPLLLPPVSGVHSQGSLEDNGWESKRAAARTEYRWLRLRDNYSTSIGTFGSKFTKWLFERAALRHKLRKLNSSSKQKCHRHEHNYDDSWYGSSDGGGWPWFGQLHKIRGKLRGLHNKYGQRRECFAASPWENWKKKFHKFVMSDYWV